MKKLIQQLKVLVLIGLVSVFARANTTMIHAIPSSITNMGGDTSKRIIPVQKEKTLGSVSPNKKSKQKEEDELNLTRVTANLLPNNFITYNKPVKVKWDTQDVFYLGKDGDKHYVYYNSSIVELNSEFEVIGEAPIFSDQKKNALLFFNGFVKNGEKFIFGLRFKSRRKVFGRGVLKIDANNKSSWINFSSMDNASENDEDYWVYLPEDRSKILLCTETSLSILDLDFNVKKKYTISEGKILRAKVTSDGSVYCLERKNEETFLVKKGAKGKRISISNMEDRRFRGMTLDIDEDLNKVFLTYLISDEKRERKEVELTKREKRRSNNKGFVAVGVHLLEYDLGSMRENLSETFFFSDEIISEARYQKEEGLIHIKNRGVNANEKNTYINLEEERSYTVSTEKSITQYIDSEGIIAINASKEDAPMVYIPKKSVSEVGSSVRRVSHVQIIKGDKLYYIFNDKLLKNRRHLVQQLVLDEDFNHISRDDYDLFAEGKTYINTSNSFPLDEEENRVLIFHNNGKWFGTAIIEFKE